MIIRRNISGFTRILLNSASQGSSNGGSKSGKSNKPTASKTQTTSSVPKVKAKNNSETSKDKNETKSSESLRVQTPPPVPEEPFRNDQYNCSEYFKHDRFSFYAFIEKMESNRLPQKSNKESYK